MATCARCGRADETVLLPWRGSAVRCPRCWVGGRRTLRRVNALVAAAAVALVALGGGWRFGLGLLAGAAAAVLLDAATVATALAAARWRVVLVNVGYGRPLLRWRRLTVRRTLPGNSVVYAPRGAVSRARHRLVLFAPRVPLVVAGVTLAFGAGSEVWWAFGWMLAVGTLGRMPAPWAATPALSARQVAAMHAALEVEEGGDLAAALAAFPGNPSVAYAHATLLLDRGDPAAAAEAVREAWRDPAADPRERALAATAYAWSLTLVEGSDRDEAWAAIRYALATLVSAGPALTAFARVLLVSGHAEDATALAGEAARYATDDRWYACAAEVATG